ncbi:MAG: hypothetical protein FD167_3461 [bacterium]|nr:MAG: hypothetical protein FD167_3461 [bacterium]
MLKIEGLGQAQKQITNVINKIKQAANSVIPELAKSPQLPLILGQGYQHGVDSQRGLKPNKPAYQKYKQKRFNSNKTLIATATTYNQAAQPGFFNFNLVTNQSLVINYNNKVAGIQASLGRNPLINNVTFIQDKVVMIAKEILARKLKE